MLVCCIEAMAVEETEILESVYIEQTHEAMYESYVCIVSV
jgi:hypothetical protein